MEHPTHLQPEDGGEHPTHQQQDHSLIHIHHQHQVDSNQPCPMEHVGGLGEEMGPDDHFGRVHQPDELTRTKSSQIQITIKQRESVHLYDEPVPGDEMRLPF